MTETHRTETRLLCSPHTHAHTHLDDGRAALLHRGDEVAVQVGVVADDGAGGLAGDGGVVDVWVLAGGVVAPDDHVLDLGAVHAAALAQLHTRKARAGKCARGGWEGCVSGGRESAGVPTY